MIKSVQLKLLKIKYSGKSIGDDIRIEIEALGKFLRVDKKIKAGTIADINEEIGRFKTDRGTFEADVLVTVMDKDILFDDVGKVTKKIEIDTANAEPQRSVFEIKVKETRSKSKKSRRGKFAIFEITLEAIIDDMRGKIVIYKDIAPASLVYLRSKPNENGAIIGKIKSGQDIIIEQLAVEGGKSTGLLSDLWHKISWNGNSGFVHSSFVELKGQERKKIIDFIKRKAKEFGIDKNIALNLAYCESKWLLFARSETKNKGIYQLGDDTIKQINKKLSGDISNPYDLWQNIDGGLRYFKSLLEKYRDTAQAQEKAITAWSRGPARVPYNKPFNIMEQSRGAQILLKCVLKNKMGEKIVKLLSVAILFLILGFGGYVYAVKNENIEPQTTGGLIYFEWDGAPSDFDDGKNDRVGLNGFDGDFNGDGRYESVKLFEFREKNLENAEYAYTTRIISQEDDFFDIDGLLYGVEAVDLNNDGVNEVAVTVVNDGMYKMVVLNYGKDGVLRPFPIFDENGSNFEGIWSKFKITIEDKDVLGAFPKIIARMPDYGGDDNSDWLGVSKYYKWNGVGFELL